MGDVFSSSSDPFAEPPAVPQDPAADVTTPIDLPPGVSEVFVEPEDPKRRSKGLLVGIGAAVLVVAAVIVGIVVATSGSSEAYSLKAASKQAASASNVAFDLKMSVAGQDLSGTARIDTEKGLMAMSLDMGALAAGSDVSVVMDLGNKVMYMDASAIPGADQLPTDWISMDLSKLPGGDQSFGSLANSNPLDTAKLFENAKTVEDKGVEEIDGEKVKHYVVTVDVSEAFDAVSGLRDQFEQMGGSLPDSIDYDVYVTEDNQLRRLRFEIDAAGQTMSTEMTVTGVGEIEPIEIPAEDDVTDLSKMLGS